MRLLLSALGLLLLTTPTLASTQDGHAADQFSASTARGDDTWWMLVNQKGQFTADITVVQGVYQDLVFDGPGACKDAQLGSATIPPHSAAITIHLDCGIVPYGRYLVTMSVGLGSATGRIDVRGARLAQ